MLSAMHIAMKDLRLLALRGSGLVQALLLGLLLVFVFSLSLQTGQKIQPQGVCAIFWLASVFCQVLLFNALYSLEEESGARLNLLLLPVPVWSIWLGKAFSGLLLLLLAQAVFLPACLVFLGPSVVSLPPASAALALSEADSIFYPLAAVILADIGLVAVGSLLAALSQGQTARESLLSIIFFPLLIPNLLAGIELLAPFFQQNPVAAEPAWFGVSFAFACIFCSAALLLFSFVYSGED